MEKGHRYQDTTRRKTWRVLDKDFETDGGRTDMICECGVDAVVPTRGDPGCQIIGVIGVGLILDPPGAKLPDDFLPDAIQCRYCKRKYEDTQNVR